jgi:hypothetical protein
MADEKFEEDTESFVAMLKKMIELIMDAMVAKK